MICQHENAIKYITSGKDDLKRCVSCYKKKQRSTLQSKNTTRIANKKHGATRRAKNKLTGYNTPSQRMYYIKRRAGIRKLSFDINIEQFKSIISQPCYWCGDPDSNAKRIGLDRINNDIGYSIGNVVPSCGPCNSIRSDKITFEEMPIVMQALLFVIFLCISIVRLLEIVVLQVILNYSCKQKLEIK